jgi:hypothetical protein
MSFVHVLEALLSYQVWSFVGAAVPTRYHANPVYGWLLRFIAWTGDLTPPDAKGTLKLPLFGYTIILERDPPIVRKVPPLLVFAALIALSGCSTTLRTEPVSPGPPEWTRSAATVIGMARGSLRVVAEQLRNDPGISVETRDKLTRAVETVDALTEASNSALDAYARSQTTDNRCHLYRVLRGVADGLVNVERGLRAAGLRIPPVVSVLLGVMASATDLASPACSTGDPPETEMALSSAASEEQ